MLLSPINCFWSQKTFRSPTMGSVNALRLTAAKGLKTPDFTNKQSFMVTLWRPSAMAADQVTDQVTDQVADQVTAHDTAQVTGQVQYLNNLTEPQRIVIVLQGEMTRDELMKKLDLKQRVNFMENYINPAIEQGWVERTRPDKPTSSKQKYRLTELGKEELEKIRNERK